MKIALDDKTLFGNDAGEDEDESVLMSYFVDQPAFADFLDPRHRLWIANGRKGTGKSALIVRFAHQLRSAPADQRAIVLSVVPSQLVAMKEPPATDNHTLLENYWKQVICGAINVELARDIGFAWNDNQMALVESAEVAGFAGRNLVGALLSRLVGKINVGGVLDLTPTPRPTANHERLLQRVDREDGLKRPVWFLLDDLDAKFQNSPAQQAFTSSFFSACRNLVKETTGIGIRASVRTDVWASLTSAEDMDKVEQYRTEIVWSATQQKMLLANRILAYLQRTDPDSDIARTWNSRDDAEALIALAFVSRMKWGQATAPAEHVLRVLAGGRPRWIAQLCRMAGALAARDNKERVGIHHVTQVMGEFGKRRLADLYKEHQYQFGDMRRLVECFSGGSRRYTTTELLQRIEERYVGKAGEKNIPLVDGVPFRDSLQLARFLFKCGFINGNNAGKTSLAVPEFVTFEARPDLLEVDTNLDDGMTWELQPAYRNILNVK
ncbi:hypothetical protein QTI66_23530 [Variovorax sp. J22R133]|uniref:P-loop ATPase, Sll1717 family n=1 Tax=Variovorax brevis TaxID=3053503 RepID=UPI0025761983|nr:hypothetical protein [Variovorax sp. J22R133]MDM0115141.1 hypothetical protein [Variovorax sp. J22R133]